MAEASKGHVVLQKQVGEWPVDSFREAVDLASRHIRPQMAQHIYPGKSRIYQRVELSRTFSEGQEARRPTWEQIEYTIQHGDVEVLLEFIQDAIQRRRSHRPIRVGLRA